MITEQVSRETWLPVTVSDVKLSQRVRHTVEDALIERAIRAATRHLERAYQISIVARLLRISLGDFPATLELNAPPLRYTDYPGDAVAIKRRVAGTFVASNGLYHVVQQDQVWALTRTTAALPTDMDANDPYAFRVEFTAGYGSAGAVPEEIQSAIILLAGHLFQNREAVIIEPRVITVPRALEYGVESLMKPYRVRTRYVSAWTEI